jgi:hypothetical protein
LSTILAGEYFVLKKLSFGRLSFSAAPEGVIRLLVIFTNLAPFLVFIALYARLLDELAPESVPHTYSLLAAAFGTFLTSFCVTLNNHTVAAFSVLFATYAGYRAWTARDGSARHFAAAGFFSAFAAVNELPALAFLVITGALLLWKAPRQTLKFFVPLTLVPLAAHFAANYTALGTFAPAYANKSAYEFPGSYWKVDPVSGRLVSTRTDPVTGKVEIRKNIDSIYEPWPVYLFHMLAGHHGIFSLSPVFILSFIGIGMLARNRGSPLRVPALLVSFLTVLLLVFYTFFAGQRNYGGATSGLRWLFWLIPLWLLFLPAGLEAVRRPKLRVLPGILLAVSVMSAFYAARNPWSRPWIHQWLSSMGWIGY